MQRLKESRRKKEWPDYYIAPTRDFTQFTADFEQQYWSRDTAFDWSQSVEANLRLHLTNLPDAEFVRVAALALPLVGQALTEHIYEVERSGLPLDEDALRAIAGCLPADRTAISQALLRLAPFERVGLPVAELKDQLVILDRQLFELREEQRIQVFRTDEGLKRLETKEEKGEQRRQVAALADQQGRVRQALKRARAETRRERQQLGEAVREELSAIAPQVLVDLFETRAFVQRFHGVGIGSAGTPLRGRLEELVLKRQLRALTDIANHALVVEQSAIAPLTMGIVHYRRRREIQEAMTTFAHDEAKHSAVFRRFMAEKMRAKERIPRAVISGGERYLWIARVMPSGAVFLAVIIEAIGGAFLEFFAQNENMPDPLFRGICRVIAERDEKRHQELCAATYNELYRTGGWWEALRNRVALRGLLQAAYGDKTEDHQLIQACRAFGLESDTLYRYVASNLSQQLEAVGMSVSWDSLMKFLPKPVPRR
ncbi:MAG: hypothetical protein E4H37_04385 [Gemmatimonadales bacterium]|nr:MAG: hypothetical protein E4H37_04385 [Gemmatimonadales bacterium]